MCPVTFNAVIKRGNVFNHFCLEICQDLLTAADARHEMAERVEKSLAAATRSE
ncbi:hypothetical protein BRAO375_1580001 [Bradyrhizobium sp. ORS 375]|nr:hypothetical protein BRAO375_1580001 [Bradyrhizobium sp. ORS 375]